MDVEISDILAQDVGEGQIADAPGDAIGNEREEDYVEVGGDHQHHGTDGETYGHPNSRIQNHVCAVVRIRSNVCRLHTVAENAPK